MHRDQLRRSRRRHQSAGARRGRPARPARTGRRAPAASAPPCPELDLGGRPRHDVGQLPQRAAGPARAQPRHQHPGGWQRGRPLLRLLLATSTRADAALNVQPDLLSAADQRPDGRAIPYTPLLRAYENDRVQIRILVGAHEEGHNFSVHGIKWLFEPSEPNSGYRNSQMMGISEHFEFIVPQLIKNADGEFVDRL